MRIPFLSAGRHSTARLSVRLQRKAIHLHLITRQRVESHPIFADPYLFRLHRKYFSTATMSASLDSATQGLAALSITSETVEHPSASSPTEWREALQAASKVPGKFELLKVLVFKPKTAKSATPIPVVVVARDATETSSSLLGKKLNLKELRLASEDLLLEFFSLDKDSRMSLSLMMMIVMMISCLWVFSEPFGSQRRDVLQGHDRRRCFLGYCTGPARRTRAFYKPISLPLRTRHPRLPTQSGNGGNEALRGRLCRVEERDDG
jgi:hypothetical protein